MTIFPVFVDGRPDYLAESPGSMSLALVPFGDSTLLDHVSQTLYPLVKAKTIVVRSFSVSEAYDRIIQAHAAVRGASTSPAEFSREISSIEPSDWVLLVDPRSYPAIGYPGAASLGGLLDDLSTAPRIVRHLVALDATGAGTNERLEFDGEGRVRRIQRYYDSVTWTVAAGVCCSLVPASSFIHAGAVSLDSLVALRRGLAGAGLASRDVPYRGRVFDLDTERGLLQLTEEASFLVSASDAAGGSERRMAASASIHPSARLVGAVTVQSEAVIDADVTIIGPSVIGARAVVEAGAVVAQSVVLPNVVVDRGTVLRHSVLGGTRSWRGRKEDRFEPFSEADPASFQLREEPRRPRVYPTVKLVIESTVAAVGLVFLSPLLFIIGVLIKLDSRGPILFGDLREAKDGKPFRCLKFRTMVVDAAAAQRDLMAVNQVDGPQFKMARDPRVTKLGRFLRAVSLDELPQLINVALGQMSLVGPRPSPFRENQTCVPWRDARLSVRPGITGLWQVCRHDRAQGDFHQWIFYDMEYVRHMSPWVDFKIVVATIITLGGKNHVPLHWIVSGTHE